MRRTPIRRGDRPRARHRGITLARGITVVAMAMGIAWLTATGADAAQRRSLPSTIRASDYPRAAHRIIAFEERINSLDPLDRRRALVELGHAWAVPVGDHVRLLRHMRRDPDPTVAGRAIRDLWRMGLHPAPSELPSRFEASTAARGGWGPIAIFDATRPESLRATEARLALGGEAAGDAAYIVGLMRDRGAVPALRRLLRDAHEGTRYMAARALVDCGDVASATRYLLSKRALEGSDESVIEGARTLVLLGRPREGLDRLARVVERLAESADDNDRRARTLARQVLWSFTGDDAVWAAPDARGASPATREDERSRSVSSRDAPAPIRASQFPRLADVIPAFAPRFNSADPDERRDALVELTYFSGVPDAELARLLRRLLDDPDPAVAGRALLELRTIGTGPSSGELPRRFEGPSAIRGGGSPGDIIDRDDPDVIASLAELGREADPRAAPEELIDEETLYLVEALGERSALPRLRRVLASPDVEQRLGVLGAMARCGARNEARAALRKDRALSDPDVSIVIRACRLLYRLGDRSPTPALRLIDAMDRLHPYQDASDEGRLIDARRVLYEMTGRYFADSRSARAWIGTHGVAAAPASAGESS